VVEGVGAVAEPVPPEAVVYQSRLVPAAVSAETAAPWQYTTGLVTIGAAGVGFTVTSICALGPSQMPTVWLTHQLIVPGDPVDGVGAVEDPVPPLAVVYHWRLVPAAVRAEAAAPWQYTTGLVTIGAAGVGLTVTSICALGPSQMPEV
jgi:hypothetical protein